MRVAVAQFATTSNVQENLATCVRMITETAVCEPSLIVLPEYCNSLYCNAQPSYLDHNQAWNEALAIDGEFLRSIGEQAKKYACYIVINVTLQRDLFRDLSNSEKNCSIKSNISVTSCLFSPQGKLIHQEDKQTLTGHENDFFISASTASELVTTPFGICGILTGSDGMTYEISRQLSLYGAQLLCNPMSTFAFDQISLHGAARSCENNVFLAQANKVGSLISQASSPQELIPQKNDTSLLADNVFSHETLVGVGQSQIISPDGKVLAKLANDKEGFTFADIDLSECDSDKSKYRPDGTKRIKQLRSELYKELTLSMKQASNHEVKKVIPVTANVAIFATYKANEQAIEDVCHYIENNLSDIIQLPELFFIEDKNTIHKAQQLAEAARLSNQLINKISAVLRPFQYVCTSLIIDGTHQAVLISEHGLFAMQQQLHFCQRYPWTALGDDVNIIELPLEQGSINVAMLTADDANIPEIVKITSLNGIHLLLVPFDIQEPCEVEYKLLSRAVENRICIVAASREKSFTDNTRINNGNNNTQNKVKYQKSTGLIVNLTTDSIFLPQWKSRKFNGYINQPLVKYQYGKITKAVIHPIAACNKRLVF